MSQSDQFDNHQNESDGINTVSDTYTTESSADIYNTPDVSADSVEDTQREETTVAGGVTESEETSEADSALTEIPAEEISETVTADSETVAEDLPSDAVADQIPSDSTPYVENPYSGQQVQNNNSPYDDSTYQNPYVDHSYGSNPYNGQQTQNNNIPYNDNSDSTYQNPYVNHSYGSNPYSGQQTQNNNSPYNDSTYQNPYGSNPYSGQQAQNSNPYGGQQTQNNNSPYNDSTYQNPYGSNPYSGQQAQNSNPYGGQQAQNSNPYGGQQAQNSNPYGGQQAQNSNPYGGQQAQNNNPYGGQATQNSNQYGVPPYGNNQYSPYAVPNKKSNNGLIIGIVAVVVVLFLIAAGALVYKVVSLYTDEKESRRNTREEYDFDDWDKDQDHRRDDHDYDDDYDYDNNHDYDDDYDNEYDYDDDYNYDDDEYYTLHDDIKDGLSYTVDFELYEYDSDYEDVEIMVFYPVISSAENIPNLDKLNATIQSEIDFLVEYFEDEYEDYFANDSDSYFHATSTGYVTYMDEEKISIVFSENVYSDYYYDAFLYSINIDMENGIVLDNESMLNVDDDFSVEFREKSDIQNGEIEHLTVMSDQEMTDHFNSSDIIVFYTPQGMEIGFNYDEGWVTVTYKEYEQYLKVF